MYSAIEQYPIPHRVDVVPVGFIGEGIEQTIVLKFFPFSLVRQRKNMTRVETPPPASLGHPHRIIF